jgi:hypothetical protein
MNIETQKLELIEWISRLQNIHIVNEIQNIKQKEKKPEQESTRKFGSGKHIFTYVADDFNEPLDDFKEYM